MTTSNNDYTGLLEAHSSIHYSYEDFFISSPPSFSDETNTAIRCDQIDFFPRKSTKTQQPISIERSQIPARSISEQRSPQIQRTASNDISVNIFERRYNEIMNGKLEYSDTTYHTTPLTDGSGDYMQAFRVLGNDSILIKSYNKRRLKDGVESLQKYMTISMEQYNAVKALKLCVAEVLNADPVNDGFCIVRRIPEAVDCFQWGRESIPFEKLSADSQALLFQAKQFFNAFVQHSLALDLMPRNLRYTRDENGVIKLALIDFREDRVKPSDMAVELKQALRYWALDNSYALAYLMADFERLNSTFNTQLRSIMADESESVSAASSSSQYQPQLSESLVVTVNRKAPPPAPVKNYPPSRFSTGSVRGRNLNSFLGRISR